MKIIEVCDLTKKYDFGKVRGIENMNFSVDEGELFGFIGPNGAGKSTTIRILMNLIRADSGKARIGGLNCATHSRQIKRFTSYMPSEVRCYPTVTVSELLDYACRLRGHEKKCWRPLTERFGLDPEKKFRELSYGNRRKLSIVQALMGKPRLLILDEPTGGLDPIMQRMFFEVLSEARSEGATVFFSSHNLGEVQKFCDRVALVKDGHVEMMPDMKALPMHMIQLTTAADCGRLLDSLTATEVKRTGSTLSFMIPGGELGTLLGLLSGIAIDDLVIDRPSLEQAFHKTYYGEGYDA